MTKENPLFKSFFPYAAFHTQEIYDAIEAISAGDDFFFSYEPTPHEITYIQEEVEKRLTYDAFDF